MTLTFDQFRAENVARCRESYCPVEDWSLSDWGNAMAGEAGEACNIVKKMRRLQATTADDPDAGPAMDHLRSALADELGDLIAYADLLAYRAGIDLGAAVAVKFNRVSNRVGSDRHLFPDKEIDRWRPEDTTKTGS